MLKYLGAGVVGGLVAGALDIAYAIIVYGARGVAPDTIFQSIASGLLGRAAFEGGRATAALGAALHFGIAIAMAIGFVALARVFPMILKRPLLVGPAYGLFLFVVMYFVVVPLSAAAAGVPSGLLLLGALFAHVALVGLPIALIAAALLASRDSGATRDRMLSS